MGIHPMKIDRMWQLMKIGFMSNIATTTVIEKQKCTLTQVEIDETNERRTMRVLEGMRLPFLFYFYFVKYIFLFSFTPTKKKCPIICLFFFRIPTIKISFYRKISGR